MLNEEHLSLLTQGSTTWNAWRDQHPEIRPHLRRADLSRAYLSGVNLSGANLNHANLNHADLSTADLSGANLNHADLNHADLYRATLYGADLYRADLSRADLSRADLRGARLGNTDLSNAELSEANLRGASVGGTHFGNVDLRSVKGLESVNHLGPSHLSTSTLIRSQGEIPEVFLLGVGLDDTFIEYVRSLVSKPVQYSTCFISYASKDEAFANRLYVDLQSKGIRCWYTPHSMHIGDVIRERMDEAIRVYDKLLLILSHHSVESPWVRFEVEAALEKEAQRAKPVLFPLRLDEIVMTSTRAWAAGLRRERHIGDFSHWKDHDAYQQAFIRLLNDLQATETDEKP